MKYFEAKILVADKKVQIFWNYIVKIFNGLDILLYLCYIVLL